MLVDPLYQTDEWYAVAVSDNGIIGGSVIIEEDERYPYYWLNRNAVPVAITMPQDFPFGEIYGVNEFGQMVGTMWNADVVPIEHAFIFDTVFGVRDLNESIDQSLGWVLECARDINNNGQITGSGTLNGISRGYMIEGFSLGVEGDINHDSEVNLEDVMVALILVSGSVEHPVNRLADLSGDQRIGIAEVIGILNKVSEE